MNIRLGGVHEYKMRVCVHEYKMRVVYMDIR